MQLSAKSCQPRSNARTATTGALKVRPYTVRKGDTLDLIAEKRGKHEEVSRLHLSQIVLLLARPATNCIN